ncbi:MAG: TVP38/TMEM64 family protein [Synechococcales cyanobacterium CRU_2_2]|nr:TVP38/TMEM64 family protein [Synechococcales cyanobacterium CRU_2_2]
MPKLKPTTWMLLLSLGLTGVLGRSLLQLDPAWVEAFLARAGLWAPLAYVCIYVIATLLVLPSTVLNLLGGAVFGLGWGLVWTSLAALVAAVVGFVLARTVGQRWAKRRTQQTRAEQPRTEQFADSGVVYLFAIRLLPLIPYGLVNFAAGLTPMRFRDYCLGTALGTVPGLLPFVWLGSSGRQAIQTGELWPLLGASASIGLLVLAAQGYKNRHERSRPPQARP